MTDQPIVVATDLFSLNMWPFQRMFKALSLQVNFVEDVTRQNNSGLYSLQGLGVLLPYF